MSSNDSSCRRRLRFYCRCRSGRGRSVTGQQSLDQPMTPLGAAQLRRQALQEPQPQGQGLADTESRAQRSWGNRVATAGISATGFLSRAVPGSVTVAAVGIR